jgi:hypothetical protein
MTAAAQRDDFAPMVGARIEKRIAPSWDIGIGTQSMFRDNASEHWFSFGSVSVGYRISRNFTTEINYRFIRFRNTENFYETRNLFFHALNYTGYSGAWSFSLRTRTQSLVYGDHFRDDFKGPRWYSRNRVMVRYRLDYYWSPYVAAETFFPLNRPTRPLVDQYRWTAGVTRTFTDRFRMDLFAQVQDLRGRQPSRIIFTPGLSVYYLIP